jgi:hypothetical protein
MSVKVTIHTAVYPPAVNQMVGWSGELGTAFRKLERQTIGVSQRLVPSEYSKSNRLRDSIKVSKRGASAKGIWTEIGSDRPYALFVESGTRTHTIEPKNPDGRLVFHWRKVGRVVRMRSVSHPGNRAYRYLEKGLIAAFTRWINSA